MVSNADEQVGSFTWPGYIPSPRVLQPRRDPARSAPSITQLENWSTVFGLSAATASRTVGLVAIVFHIAVLRRSRLFGQLPGRNKLKAGSRLLVSPFPEIKFILSCCGVL